MEYIISVEAVHFPIPECWGVVLHPLALTNRISKSGSGYPDHNLNHRPHLATSPTPSSSTITTITMEFNNSFGRPSDRGYTNFSASFSPCSYAASRSISTRVSTSRRVATTNTVKRSTLPHPLPMSNPPSSPVSVSPIPRTKTAVTPPTAYRPLSPPPSSAAKHDPLANLLPTPRSIFDQISQHVLAHRTVLRPHSVPIHINHVSPSVFDTFLANDRDAPLLKRIKLEYDARSSRLTMCPPPLPYHDCTPYFLQSALFALRGTPFDTPARQRSLVVREVAFRSSDGSYMVPDAAVVVTPVGAPARIWPTVVVEVANTQGYEDALAKVKRWFARSHGMVEVALLLKFTAQDPVVDPACFLEVWRYGRPDDQDAMVLEWEGEIGEGDGPVADLEDSDELSDVSSGSEHSEHHQQSQPVENFPPDVIPVESVDLEDSVSADSETDAYIPVDDGETTAADHLGSPPDAAGNIDPDLIPADAHTGLTDSDSSLSSLDDDEAPPIPDGNSSDGASSSSSSASTSAYHPTPRRHRFHMYLSGARQTVLPVADPIDPAMQYLPLRYSDFFGSENVPVGRDADQQVLLDLDELRLEISLLVGLTEGIEGNVRKRAGEEEGQRGGKRARR